MKQTYLQKIDEKMIVLALLARSVSGINIPNINDRISDSMFDKYNSLLLNMNVYFLKTTIAIQGGSSSLVAKLISKNNQMTAPYSNGIIAGEYDSDIQANESFIPTQFQFLLQKGRQLFSYPNLVAFPNPTANGQINSEYLKLYNGKFSIQENDKVILNDVPLLDSYDVGQTQNYILGTAAAPQPVDELHLDSWGEVPLSKVLVCQGGTNYNLIINATSQLITANLPTDPGAIQFIMKGYKITEKLF